ncbi:MAG: sensor histidine kinase, partial [Ramlibacter sp.]
GANADELKQSLKQIGRSSMRATHTVNQLLALARAETSGKTLPRHPCDLAQLTREVVQDLLPRALDRRVDLGYEGALPGAPGVRIQGNPTLLKELIRNLLDNAINYTPSSDAQPAVVTARVLPDPIGRVVVLQVEDSGPGIPEGERELVFQPFYRSLGTNVDGSGLGLPIVLEIARQHGAEIHIEDAHPGHVPPGARVALRFLGSVPAGLEGADAAQAA